MPTITNTTTQGISLGYQTNWAAVDPTATPQAWATALAGATADIGTDAPSGAAGSLNLAPGQAYVLPANFATLLLQTDGLSLDFSDA